MKTQLSKPARNKSELHRAIQTGGAGVMACQWPQRGQGSGGAGDSSAAALSLGALGARVQRCQERAKAEAQRRRTRSGDPALTRGERQAFRAA